MKKYWISWYQPGDDYRPLSFPPNDKIVGWWATGYSANDMTTLVAFVCADNDSEAAEAILKDWPEATQNDWRFFEERDDIQLGDRFKLSEWMLERLKKIEERT
jgi:mevalonate kinase